MSEYLQTSTNLPTNLIHELREMIPEDAVKMKLEFQMDTCYGKISATRALLADEICTAVYEFDQWLRKEYKYTEGYSAERFLYIDKIRDELRDFLLAAGITWEMIE